MGKLTEEDKLFRRVEQRFNKGSVRYGLLQDGDCILVGLSGGKDSLALLELLARRSRILKPRFTVVAAHVVMSNIAYESDAGYLRSFAEGLGVEYVHYETSCSSVRSQGAVSTMPPKLVMRKFDMTIIRPMCLVHESDLIQLAAVRGYRKQVKNCPYEKDSHRSDMKGVLRQLEQMNPEARYSLWNSMNNIQSDLLPQEETGEPSGC